MHERSREICWFFEFLFPDDPRKRNNGPTFSQWGEKEKKKKFKDANGRQENV